MFLCHSHQQPTTQRPNLPAPSERVLLHKGLSKNASVPRAQSNRHVRKLQERASKIARARAALTRKEERLAREQSAVLEKAVLNKVVHVTAWEATRAWTKAKCAVDNSKLRAGMQGDNCAVEAASVMVTPGDWSPKRSLQDSMENEFKHSYLY